MVLSEDQKSGVLEQRIINYIDAQRNRLSLSQIATDLSAECHARQGEDIIKVPSWESVFYRHLLEGKPENKERLAAENPALAYLMFWMTNDVEGKKILLRASFPNDPITMHDLMRTNDLEIVPKQMIAGFDDAVYLVHHGTKRVEEFAARLDNLDPLNQLTELAYTQLMVLGHTEVAEEFLARAHTMSLSTTTNFLRPRLNYLFSYYPREVIDIIKDCTFYIIQRPYARKTLQVKNSVAGRIPKDKDTVSIIYTPSQSSETRRVKEEERF